MTTLENGVPLSRLSRMTALERKRAIDEIIRQSVNPTSEELQEQRAALLARISQYEIRYEISSQQMLSDLRANRMRETADICSWVMLLRTKARLDGIG